MALSPPIARILGTVAPALVSPGIAVPILRQPNAYSCGPTALRAVQRFMGATETGLDASPREGVAPEALVEAAKRSGLSAEYRTGLSVRDLGAALAAGTVPILSYQQEGGGWSEGHYAPVVKADVSGVVVMDPGPGRYVRIGADELMPMWHDEDGGKARYRGAVLVGRA
jgi:hypothetical protein